MASISGAAQRRDPRSGGKMVRPSRTMIRPSPYDRPRLLNSTHENPNWISRNIFSPTRSIVSGATRALTSVFRFESSSSSSDSDSDSDSDSASDDTGGTNDDQGVSTQGLNNIEHSEPQSFAGKIETKRLIEQLLMQESFSREECDKLTNIIKSRVVDSPMIGGMGIERLNETPNRTEVDTPGTAAIKAKKWLEEKKSGSNSKSELHHVTSALNFSTLPHSVEGEAGSPVDMAKTYMRTRIPWASPFTNDVEFKSPSPFGVPLFKEETPYSTGGNYLSSSKRKRDSSATCSWNIQEEIRKVRSKATEEMLRTLSSPKIDWSSFALEHKTAPDSLAAKTLAPAEENNPQSSKKSVDASEDLATRPGAPVSQIPENASNSDALPIPASLGCEENQGMEAVQRTEGKRGETLDEGQRLQSTVDIKTASNSEVVAADVNHCKDTNGSILQFGSYREGTLLGKKLPICSSGSKIEDKSCLALKEVAETGGASSTVNGLPSEYSMQAEVDKEQNHGLVNEEENTVGPGDENAIKVAPEDKGEASIEVAVANENDVALSESQHSSSMQFEDEDEGEGLPQQLNTRDAKRKTSTAVEKQQVKKVSKNGRRGRGRVR